MKMYFFDRYKKRAVFALVFIIIVLFLAVSHIPDGAAGVFNSREVDPYEIKSRLLMDAVQHTGVCTPEESVNVWAEGVRLRNGAMQYIVMYDTLKRTYATSLEKAFPNWVTGTSSPWVESYAITEASRGENSRNYTVEFKTKTSAGPAGNYTARLSAARENGFWQISRIEQSSGLQAFTGLQP